MDRNDVARMLAEWDVGRLVDAARMDFKGIVRRLLGFSYDRQTILCWRAIEAVGIACGEIAKTNQETVRGQLQRLLWMMRDESGNNPGSAPEIIGEIVRNSPDAFPDIPPILASFHDEEMLRPGVLRGLWRIIDVRPDLISLSDEFLRAALEDGAAAVRVYGLMIGEALVRRALSDAVERLRGDKSEVILYDTGQFRRMHVGDLAARVLERWGTGGYEDVQGADG